MQNGSRFWKIAAIVVVTILTMNPELFMLGLFINAIGLDVFYLLVEIQIFSAFALFVQTQVKPFFAFVDSLITKIDPYYFIPTKEIVVKYPPILLHAVPGLVATYLVLILGFS